MEFKGTKGEWVINRISGIATGIGVAEKVEGGTYTTMMCEFFLPDTDEEYEESDIEANAKLIAAAPDLLEALQILFDVDEVDSHALFNAQVKAQQAINKALN